MTAIGKFKKKAHSQAERFRLTVSGIVTYGPDDSDLRDLLLKEENARGKLAEALQELEEEAADVKIIMEKLS